MAIPAVDHEFWRVCSRYSRAFGPNRDGDLVAEITTFGSSMFPRPGLPDVL